MKKCLFSYSFGLGLILLGMGIGYLMPIDNSSRESPDEAVAMDEAARSDTINRRLERGLREGLSRSEQLNRLSQMAESLSPEEWPNFYQALRDNPIWESFALTFWMENHPESFWDWLCQQKDSVLIGKHAQDLFSVWVINDPEAAKEAAFSISSARLGEKCRRVIVDSALRADLEMGLKFAAEAGRIREFGWGGIREWMKTDPEAAVRGLAALPVNASYRMNIEAALEVWVSKDPAKAGEWLATFDHDSFEKDFFGDWSSKGNWFERGLVAISKNDESAGWDLALNVSNEKARNEMIAVLIKNGQFDQARVEIAQELLGDTRWRKEMANGIRHLARRGSSEHLELTDQLMATAPVNSHTRNSVESIARFRAREDLTSAGDWAASLERPFQRIAAVTGLMFHSSREHSLSDYVEIVEAIPQSEWTSGILESLVNKAQGDEAEKLDQLRRLNPDMAKAVEINREASK